MFTILIETNTQSNKITKNKIKEYKKDKFIVVQEPVPTYSLNQEASPLLLLKSIILLFFIFRKRTFTKG